MIRPFIHDAKVLGESFRSCQFVFIGRTGNRTAHIMASMGREASTGGFWVEEAPSPVLFSAATDRKWVNPP
ncbi:hypothetical protein GQ457_03G015680 [Hibiscus cannabinus]